MVCVSDIDMPAEFFSYECRRSFAPTFGHLLRDCFEIADLEGFLSTPPHPTDALDFSIMRCSYRPFDTRYIIYTGHAGIISHPRAKTMRHLAPWWMRGCTRRLIERTRDMPAAELARIREDSVQDFYSAPLALIAVCLFNTARVADYMLQCRRGEYVQGSLF